MRIDYHGDRAFRFSNVFRFLVMINREEIALFPAIEVECSPARAYSSEEGRGIVTRMRSGDLV
jgi:hypothetical protein